jgi:hypothetical protein
MKSWIAAMTAVGGTGSGLGYAATGEPIVFLTVLAGIVCVGAALGVGVGLAMGLSEGIGHRLGARMGASQSRSEKTEA